MSILKDAKKNNALLLILDSLKYAKVFLNFSTSKAEGRLRKLRKCLCV